MTKNLWTPEQDQYLRDHWQEMSDEEMAAVVGHPLTSTKARRGKLGLYERKGYRGKDWSPEELAYIHEVWGEKTVPEIARKLGRSINAVNRTDFPIIIDGTSDECAKALNRSRSSFYCMVDRVRKGKNKRYTVLQRMVDEEDIEDG